MPKGHSEIKTKSEAQAMAELVSCLLRKEEPSEELKDVWAEIAHVEKGRQGLVRIGLRTGYAARIRVLDGI
jgi:hypothetical protein